MKKRIISSILSICMLVSLISIFSVNSFAEDSRYNELMEQKKEYMSELYPNGCGFGEWYYPRPYISPSLTVLLYTDAAKKITLEKNIDDGGELIGPHITMFVMNGNEEADMYLTSPEIFEATKKIGRGESRSALRECVKYFEISKEDLLEAFKTMKENPDAIRPLLSFLTDEEYESAKMSDGTFGKTDWPEFVIEAMFIEDDKKAHDLISKPNAVYVSELGRAVTATELDFAFISDNSGGVSLDELLTYDLTSDTMGDFIQFIKESIKSEENEYYITAEHVALLEKERARQLAVQTGEELIFIPLAALSFAAAVALINPKLRRRLN